MISLHLSIGYLIIESYKQTEGKIALTNQGKVMHIYRSLLIVGLLFFSGCNRSGEDAGVSLGASSVIPNGGKVLFDVISKSNTLVDVTGNFRDSGHYSMVYQAKTDKGGLPVAGLDDDSFYTMFENNVRVNESKLKVSQDSKTVSNKILLLLDFSGSIVDDCNEVDAMSNPKNLCYQIVNSSKKFVDQIISENQTMAIYYFNSKRKIQPLWQSPSGSYTTSDRKSLKASLDKLYDAAWRRDNLEGYNSTNLYGAIIDSTSVVCRWFDDCIEGQGSEIGDGNKKSYDFATIVIFTDGRHTVGDAVAKQNDMLHVLPLYKRNYYYTIGLGDVDDAVLKEIGKDGYLKATQTEKLDVEFGKLGEKLSAFSNSFYRLDYCPAQQAGVLDLRINVTDRERRFYGDIKERIELLNNLDFRCDL